MTDSLCVLKEFLINLKYVSVVFCSYSETCQNPVRTFSFETAKLMLILTVPETPCLYLITYTNLSCLSCDKIKNYLRSEVVYSLPYSVKVRIVVLVCLWAASSPEYLMTEVTG